jgi:arylsulfatase A-like enzyme
MKIWKRNLFGTAASLLFMTHTVTATGPRPNIILIYVDDLAYGDVPAFGCPDFKTPAIDTLAENGVRLTQFYTANSPCSPSRAGLLMGMYTQRFGKFGLSRGVPLPEDKPTLAETLRDAGYVTGFVGTEKWDMGAWNQGALDEGFIEMGKHPPRVKGKEYFGGGSSFLGVDGSYLSEVEGQYAVEFVERHANGNKPFFLYFTPLAVHKPCEEVPEKYLKRLYPDHTGDAYEKRQYLGATLLALDDQIRNIWKKVHELGIEKNTLFIFSSDNGGDGSAGCRNAPFKGGKNTPWEGNMRMPTIFTFPGTLPKGTEYTGIGSTLDFYATAVELAQTPRPAHLDGKNLLPLLRGAVAGDPNETLFWDNEKNTQAVRWKQWRLMRVPRGKQSPWQLYDILKDPGETTNLANKYPEVVESMAKQWQVWRDQMPEPANKVRPPRKFAVATKGGDHARRPFGRGWMMIDEWEQIKEDPTQWSEDCMREKMVQAFNE